MLFKRPITTLRTRRQDTSNQPPLVVFPNGIRERTAESKSTSGQEDSSHNLHPLDDRWSYRALIGFSLLMLAFFVVLGMLGAPALIGS